MLRTRVIPCLLLHGDGLVKTTRFRDPVYVGDPINAIKIFNEKEVDELILVDILATIEGRRPRLDVVRKITNECFMPLCYGGGIRDLADIEALFGLGVEKVSLSSAAIADPSLLTRAAEVFGSQSIVVTLDVKRVANGGYEVFTHGGTRGTGLDPIAMAQRAQEHGAGELVLNSIDRDGTREGYDVDLIGRVVGEVSVPVIAIGGAGSVADFGAAIRAGASAVAAGSLFVFFGKHKAVLINYPMRAKLESVLP